MWCLADWTGTVTFSSVFLSPVQLFLTFGRAGMCLFLPGKPSSMSGAREGELYGAGLQRERKGNFPKGSE